jgi:hypothetical protein
MSGRDDLFLLIRVHPREFPTKRELQATEQKRSGRQGITSSHARRLQKYLVDLPSNCAVNWPTDNVSLYDLAKEADVILNAWSSAGMEMGLLGLPVVEWASEQLLYAGQADLCAADADDYGAKIEFALDRGWSPDAMRAMYRWCALQYGTATFETRSPAWLGPDSKIGSGLRSSRNLIRRLDPDLFDAYLARIGTVDVEDVAKVVKSGVATLAHVRTEGPENDPAAETAALAGEVERVVRGLFPGGHSGSSKLYRNLMGFVSSQNNVLMDVGDRYPEDTGARNSVTA